MDQSPAAVKEEDAVWVTKSGWPPVSTVSDDSLLDSAARLVTLFMAVGALWGGFRVLRIRSHRVVPLDAGSGVGANVGTSLLVLLASPLGIPVSTTHVSTGSLLGIRWSQGRRPRQGDALRAILFAWLITLPVAAGLAALSGLLLSGD